MEKYGLKKNIQKKLNIPITPENVYATTSIGNKYETSDPKEHTHPHRHPQLPQKNVKYLDELYSASFMDAYFS